MEKYVTLAEVRKMLEKEADGRELSYEQRTALQHASTLSTLSTTKSRKLVKDLMKYERVNEFYACKLADIMPTEPTEVRAIFMRERFELDADEIKGILETLAEYRV